MEIRILIDSQGNTRMETISALEDLWHDFLFFRDQAVELDKPAHSATNQLIARRYSRAALLVLLCYFEGVVGRHPRDLSTFHASGVDQSAAPLGNSAGWRR